MLGILLYFLNTRVWIEKYTLMGDTLRFENNVYISKGANSESDTDNLGETIGIAVSGKRTVADYIWPVWIYEYKDDKEHNRIFVRGLMDLGSAYIKQSK